MDFTALVSSTTRSSDDYVNASKWCAAFGKHFRDYIRYQGTQNRWKAIAERIGVNSPQLKQTTRGANGTTWIHPLCAIDLAMWLSPEFAVYVNQTFKRYLDADITLADEVLQRSTKEDAEWLQARVEGKLARLAFTEELKQRGCSKLGFAKNTNAVYVGLFGQPASALKEELAVKNPRDGMTRAQLLAIALTEELAVDQFAKDQAFGDKATVKSTLHVSRTLGEAIDGL